MKPNTRKKNTRPRRVATRQYQDKDLMFSYKDVNTLTRFITEQGALIPRSESGLTQKQQRLLTSEVKRARHLALLPFTQTL